MKKKEKKRHKTKKNSIEIRSIIFSEKQPVEKENEKEIEKEKEPTQIPTTPKNPVTALYTPIIKSPAGPCRYLDGNRRQNHQCRRDTGLPDAIKEARRLALTHCQEQFRYDRWNCTIETKGKRNIFKKVNSILSLLLLAFPTLTYEKLLNVKEEKPIFLVENSNIPINIEFSCIRFTEKRHSCTR